jgi:hypothetical protein
VARGGIDDATRWNLFRQDVATNYPGLNTDYFDPATALVFWLGGLPEHMPDLAAGEKWIPAGFHADKANPFKSGLPRTEPFFAFNAERLIAQPHPVRGIRLQYNPPAIDEAPYVYFRARFDANSGRSEYAFMLDANTPNAFTYFHAANADVCLPYTNGTITIAEPRPWCEPKKYQIITAGMDGQFGLLPTDWPPTIRNLYDGSAISNFDFDNITSFADGKLEDAMPK